MSFEIAIYNAGCCDGAKVINSIKTAYLYADAVRVYDNTITEGTEELRPDLTFSSYVENNRKAITLSEKRLKEGITPEEEKILFDAHFDILAFCNIEIIRSYDMTARVDNQIREVTSNQYVFTEYETDLKRMGIDFIVPEINVSDLETSAKRVRDFSKKYRNDEGFKLVNSFPIELKDAIVRPSVFAPAYLSDYAISTLPGFENATIDEIIDIRRELDKYIVPYRNAVVKMAGSINGITDMKELQQECKILYLKDIQPQVNAINAAIGDNNVFKNMAYDVALDPGIWAATAGIVFALANKGDITNALSLMAAPVIGATIPSTIKRVIDYEENKKVKENEMFFLYETGKQLKRKQ